MGDFYILLGAVSITIIIGTAIAGYMRLLRRKMKRHVLRWEEIEKHFKKGER